MRSLRRLSLLAAVGAVIVLTGLAPHAQTAAAPQRPVPPPAGPARAPQTTALTTPMAEFGHNIGDDYYLINYQQLMAYWRKLEKQSPRLHIVEIGKTSQGRPMLMAIITSPANYAKLARYKEISQTLAKGEGPEPAARALAREGKAVVWIDGGLHATETLGAQQLLQHVWEMVSRDDAETQRFLDDVIQVCVLVNPDGMDLVSDWYMQHGNMNTPVLYNHYAGHDDNRDFYMAALAESTNIDRVMYREWLPQIMYNHHQTGPAGTVMFAPPFRDPYNYYQHPYAIAGIDVVGAMMMERFLVEGKPGVTQRRGAPYSTWFNGGIRTTAHFHNMIGILTETIGSPDPASIPFVAAKQLGDSNLWMPIKPQTEWHMTQSIDYSMTANRAILDYASRYREKVLYDIWKMGHDEIQWGSEDHWTFSPHKMAQVQETGIAKGTITAPTVIPGAASTSQYGGRGAGRGGGGGGGRGGGRGEDPLYAALTSKELRDPRGFIIPSDQPDFGSATRFINTLLKNGITVLRANAAFTVNGKSYPANSFVVKTAQAFRPHVMDMFEPQDHPDDIPYPGGPPTPPYDATGYTLAFQMGVQFDRILDGFEGPFVPVGDVAKPPAGIIKTAPQGPAGYLFSHASTDSFIVINRLLAKSEDVVWLADGQSFFVAQKPTTLAILQKAATDLGVSFQSVATAPAGGFSLKKLRIGLFDEYGGSMPSGWTRLVLENFEFPGFEDPTKPSLVFAPDLDKGNLRSRYDVLVFVDGGTAGGGRGGGGGGRQGGGAGAAAGGGAGAAGAAGATPPANPQRGAGAGAGAGGGAQRPGRGSFTPAPIPPEFAVRQGAVNAQTMDQVKQFVNEGGTVIYVGNAAMGAAQAFGLPLVDQTADLPNDKFYVPGAVLRVSIDNKQPLAHGLPSELDVFFNNNPAFKLSGDAKNMQSVAWFANATPLRSGWAWGQGALDKGIEIVSAKIGRGNVFLFAPEILYRSQPHSNFRLFFNGLYLSVAQAR